MSSCTYTHVNFLLRQSYGFSTRGSADTDKLDQYTLSDYSGIDRGSLTFTSVVTISGQTHVQSLFSLSHVKKPR